MEDLSLLRSDNVRGSYKKEHLPDNELAEAFQEVRAKYRKLGIYLPENKMDINLESIAWKTVHFAKIPADRAYAEIERIKEKYGGLLTAEILLDESKNDEALFHPCFVWDNDEAADLFRVQQAKQILRSITLTVITDGEPKRMRVYEIVKRGDPSEYKSVNTFNEQDIEYIRRQVIKGLTQYRNKLSVYDQFNVSVSHLDNAIVALESEPQEASSS